MRILIVEDDISGVMLLRKILYNYGEIADVNDGPKAIEAFEKAWNEGNPYNLIFLDIMMPSMSGQDVLSTIRKKETEMRLPQLKEVKVIITSALDSVDSVSQAFNEGRASAYLVKPILKHHVLEEINKLGFV
ncbi:MAG: response regulator [Deltaproteobacteria bacterium HGW-Deltaproteobacteria-18]|jgi:two-component system chemotaxis response regulator CheY|nr:MAG: response regulator [Deltaproteobacteria bacterium HGW-Deltaproteobacteria-18]